MKTAAHQYEDKLLEFAYGELARPEAEAVEAHVRTCTRCSEALAEIRGVRATMAQLPMVAAPDAGLESLLAYAEQAAKRNAEKAPVSIWRRFLAPVVTVMALLTVGVVGLRAKDDFDTNPASVAADQKVAEKERADLAKKSEAPAPIAQAETVKEARPTEKDEAEGGAKNKLEDRAQLDGLTQQEPPVVAAVAPAPEKPNDAPDLPVWDATAYNKKGAKKAAPKSAPTPGPQPVMKSIPQSMTRRAISNEETASKDDNAAALGDLSTKGGLRNDFMNSGAGLRDTQPKAKAAEEKKAEERQAAKKEAKEQAETESLAKADKAPTMPPPPPPKTAAPEQQKQVWSPPPQEAPPSNGPAFGLGSSAPSGTSNVQGGSLGGGGLSTPGAGKTAVREEPKADPKPAKDAYRGGYDQPAPAPAPVVASPTTPAAPTTAPIAPRKSMSFPQLSTGSSGASGRGAGDDEDGVVLQNADNRSLNEDAKVSANQRAKASADALERARVASNRGDRTSEIELAKKSLSLGTQGADRAEALKRLCDAYDALGEPEQADPFCRALVAEFPTSISARQVLDRRNRAAPSAKKPVRAKEERRAVDMESVDKPEPTKAVTGEAY
ncbi:MAG: hypothetical protein U0228_16345 [Myxococcaceae bacterium]